jgi:hypothetical protein
MMGMRAVDVLCLLVEGGDEEPDSGAAARGAHAEQ